MKFEEKAFQKVLSFFLFSYFLIFFFVKLKKKVMEKRRRLWVSIPLPSACKADALPFELNPHLFDIINFKKKLPFIIIII